MAQASRPCKGCGALIFRTAPVAPIRHYCSDDCRPRCSVDGCEKAAHARGMCPAHSTRATRFGDPLTPKTRQSNMGDCSVEGCERPSRKRGWCDSHYSQWHATGEVKPFIFTWGDGGYGSTHRLIVRRRGKAANHLCVDCGQDAAEWSYDGADPDAITDGRGLTFSRDPARYSPRCVRCHRLKDENPIAVRRVTRNGL